jgi:hypothetical protein
MDVRLANLAPGPTTAGTDLLPNNAVGGVVGVVSSSSFNTTNPTATINASYVVCSSAIMGRFAKQLDIQMDDGVYTTGSLRILSYTNNTRGSVLTVPQTVDDNLTYVVCMGI